MKTMKLALVLAFVSFAAMTFADNGPERKTVTVKMALEKAKCIKSLKTEMLQQIDRSLISVEKSGLYFARVRYRNNYYIIFGKYKEWKAFFDMSHWKSVGPPEGIRPDFTN